MVIEVMGHKQYFSAAQYHYEESRVAFSALQKMMDAGHTKLTKLTIRICIAASFIYSLSSYT